MPPSFGRKNPTAFAPSWRSVAGEADEAAKHLAARDRELTAQTRAAKEQSERAAALAGEIDGLKRAADELVARADRAESEAHAMVPRADHERLEKELGAAREQLEQTTRERVPAEELRLRDEKIAGLEQSVKAAPLAAPRMALPANWPRAIRPYWSSRRDSSRASRPSPAALPSRLATRDRRIAELEAAIKQAGGKNDEVAAMTARLRQQEHELAALNAKLAAAQAKVAEPGKAQQEISRRDEAIVTLKKRLDQALAEARHGQGKAAGASDAADARRERLRRYKGLLQQQARKIVAAQNGLQRRHADCEMVLQNRVRLAELARELARAEKKVTAGKARSGAAVAVLYMVATLGVLALMSWEVSKRVWPGTYIARAIRAAAAARRSPKPEDLAAWQKDHADMLSDPRLIELAAQRMQQRGLVSLGSPAELGSRLKQDMYVQSSKPGSLTVELRGEGAEKTALVLDTLVTSFKSVSDQARDERSNDIGVTIAQAATPGAEPLMDKRLEKAGEVFGGAALAAALAGLVIWTRLVKAKKKFDQRRGR